MSALRITRIFLQPVKSLRGHGVEAADVDELGLAGDRRFLVVDEAGTFLTQRSLPRMATVTARAEGEMLRLAAPGLAELQVPLRSPAAGGRSLRQVRIWKSEGLLAEDCGRDAARWLTEAIGAPCGLVRIGPEFVRPIPLARVPDPLKPRAPGVAFSDAFPFMIIGEATLDDLNGRLADEGLPPMPMERFRPSFAFSGGTPFAEDTWPRLKVGGLTLHAAGRCSRCILTCTDPWSGERGHEPLRLLATYRRDARDPSQVMFGQNAIHAYAGPGARIAVGDPIEPDAA